MSGDAPTAPIFVTYDGDTYWLACFADDPDDEHGDSLHPIDAGDTWEIRGHGAMTDTRPPWFRVTPAP